jgi:hypothetical protein
MQPTKAEMKKRLAEVRNAALLLRDALNDTPIREFLEIAPLGPIEFRGVFDEMVQELAGRAERAKGIDATVDGNGQDEGRPYKSRATRCFVGKIVLRGSDRRSVGVFPSQRPTAAKSGRRPCGGRILARGRRGNK